MLFVGQLISQDKMHFYATTSLWQEPRFEKDLLFSFDAEFKEGSTNKGRACGCFSPMLTCEDGLVELLDIYGKHNMQLLGLNVPQKELDKFPDTTLTLLSLLPTRENFGQFSFSGTFNISQIDITLTQNFKRGFFATMHLPIRHLEISCIQYTDLSPDGPQIPNKKNPVWQSFLTQFDTIMEVAGLNIGAFKKNGVGDLSCMLGWTNNYETTEFMDFVDITIKTGILFPSGDKKDPDKVFGLPMGYDGHVGLPLSLDVAFGLYEWLTIGGHLEGLFLFNHTKDLRIKTAAQQSGFIKLAKTEANVRPGAIGKLGTFVKADHVIGGLSLLIGYSFSVKANDKIDPCSTGDFNAFIAENDQMFQQWKIHTIHGAAEYDFTREEARFGPRVGLFYNWDVGGKRTFKTNTAGVTIGLDITLDY